MDDTVICALSGMFLAVCAAIGKDRSEMAAQIIRSAAINPQTEADEARIYSAIAEDFDCVSIAVVLRGQEHTNFGNRVMAD